MLISKSNADVSWDQQALAKAQPSTIFLQNPKN